MNDYYEKIEFVAELIKLPSPSRKDLVNFLKVINGDSKVEDYFYSNNKNEKWFPLLKDEGVFNQVPQAIHTEGGYRCSNWPQSTYLATIAKELPKGVLGVILDYDTNHIFVMRDCLQALQKMPIDVAIQGVDLILRLVSKDAYRDWHFVGREAAKLMVAFADNGYVDQGFAIAEQLLKVQVDKDRHWISWEDLEGRYDSHDYKDLVFEYYSKLWNHDTHKAGALLIDLLDSCIEEVKQLRSTEDQDENYDPTDTSYILIPDLAKAEDSWHGIGRMIVAGIRAAGETLCKGESDKELNNYFDYLRSKNRGIFLRIELYLLALASLTEERKAKIEAILAQPDEYNWHNPNTEIEFQKLLHDKWESLSKSAQNFFIKWATGRIVENLDDFKQWFRETRKREATSDDIEAYGHMRRASALYCIRDKVADLYEFHFKASGRNEEDVKPLPRGVTSVTWSGAPDKSPIVPEGKTAEEFTKEVLQFDRDNPDNEEERHQSEIDNKEALANRFKQDIVERAVEYILLEPDLILELSRRYVRNYIYGMTEAVESRKLENPDWQRLVAFSERCVEQKMFDLDHEEVLQAIPRLFEKGLRGKVSLFPIEVNLLDRVFKILRALIDFNDRREDKEEYRDAFSAAINCVQGAAFENIVRFGLYCKNKDAEMFENQFASNFTDALQDIMKRHRKIKVQCIFGVFFGQLCWLAPEWMEANVDEIFPEDDSKIWNANWGCYMQWGGISKQAFDIARQKYINAISRIRREGHDTNEEDRDKELVKHIMQAFWQGWIERDGDLLDQLIEQANDELMSEACRILTRGFSFLKEHERDDWRAGVEARLLAYWEKRYKVMKNDASTCPAEAEEFTRWIKDSPFDKNTALDIAERAVELSSGSIGKRRVAGEFINGACNLAEGSELRILRLLRSVMDDPEVGVSFYSFEEKLGGFFDHLANLPESYPSRMEIYKVAIKIADLFGRMGHEEFKGHYHKMKKIVSS